jgi:hypothetical protein
VVTVKPILSRHVAAAEKAAAALEPLSTLFAGQTALVFASGPSLTDLWSPDRSIPLPSIAVNDAWRVAPAADILYATDAAWWMHHKAVPAFAGVRVGYEGPGPAGIIWLQGTGGDGYDPRLGYVRHGQGSGYAAAHLAAQLGAKRIVLVGFDCRPVADKEHFFGSHDQQIRKPMPYAVWSERFAVLAKELAAREIELVNATPGSALKLPTCPLSRIVLGGRSARECPMGSPLVESAESH